MCFQVRLDQGSNRTLAKAQIALYIYVFIYKHKLIIVLLFVPECKDQFACKHMPDDALKCKNEKDRRLCPRLCNACKEGKLISNDTNNNFYYFKQQYNNHFNILYPPDVVYDLALGNFYDVNLGWCDNCSLTKIPGPNGEYMELEIGEYQCFGELEHAHEYYPTDFFDAVKNKCICLCNKTLSKLKVLCSGHCQVHLQAVS